jgi:hypothetical protein
MGSFPLTRGCLFLLEKHVEKRSGKREKNRKEKTEKNGKKTLGKILDFCF